VRYSFHGKIRATGQQVDGFVEAPSASIAIDRLADQGIIGVYTVRPEPKPPKNAVYIPGQSPEPEEDHAPPQLPQQLPRLERPVRRPPVGQPALPARKPPQTPVPVPTQPVQADAPPVPADPAMGQIVEKLSFLMSQVEKILARPAQVVYQNSPARSVGTGEKRKGRMPTEVQSNTLRDIFQNNLDLRQSLEKLATTVGAPPAAAVVTSAAARVTNGGSGAAFEVPKPAREGPANGHAMTGTAQPAA
jgi:hypothetical protein